MQATKCHSCLNKITLHQGRWCNNKNKNYSEVGEYLCCIISIVAHVAIGWWNHQKKNVATCGSHNIRSPYGFWLFCILACLAAAVVFKVVHVYLQDHQEVPVQQSVLEVIRTQ